MSQNEFLRLRINNVFRETRMLLCKFYNGYNVSYKISVIPKLN